MTRYIDADAIDKRYVPIAPIVDWGTVHYEWVAFIDDINELPTIDAIPISFIEKKIESIRQYLKEHEGEAFTSGLISKAIAYEKLIEYWREENGQTD